MKHLPSISRILPLLAVAAIFSLLAAGNGSAQTTNERKEAAYTRFKKIRNQVPHVASDSEKHKALKLERKLLEIIELVPSDTPRLCYDTVERRLLHGNSRWAEYEDVTITHCENYYPNRLIGKIRMLYPPHPWLTSQVCGERGRRRLIVRLTNGGDTRLENVTLEIRHRSGSLGIRNIRTVSAHETCTVSWDLESGAHQKIKLIMGEKYGFVSYPQTIHI